MLLEKIDEHRAAGNLNGKLGLGQHRRGLHVCWNGEGGEREEGFCCFSL